jgi:hypothetical protein
MLKTQHFAIKRNERSLRPSLNAGTIISSPPYVDISCQIGGFDLITEEQSASS